MKRSLIFLVGLLIALMIATAWWVKFDSGPPTIEFQQAAEFVGRQLSWDVVVGAAGYSGLRRVDVSLRAGGKVYPLFAEEFEPVSWVGSRVARRQLHVEADLAAAGVPEGHGQIEVFADTYAWRLLAQRGTLAERAVMIDLTPPGVELLTTQHNMRLGGSSVALFRMTPDAVRAGVAVEDYFFPAVRGAFADPAVAVAIFAAPQDLSADVQPVVRVADGVDNTREVALPCLIRDRQFGERSLSVSDQFLQRKMPEIFAASGRPMPDDLIEAYLYVNRDLRQESERRLRELTARSIDAPLWDGAFRRQPNAAPMSAFADRRSYEYGGNIIDRQTHLGYDLASLKHAAVEAAQNGVVVHAGWLGIYGNAVVLDHGLGVFSLYGHMSTVAVQPGQRVRSGETLGQTGETGLAGGDHLHFSIMLRGIHVDPLEWWDEAWIRDHVAAKLTALPPAAGISGETRPDGQAQP